MDFSDTPEEAAFRAEVINFLDANATRKTKRRTRLRSSGRRPHRQSQSLAGEESQRGFARITWPKAWGGLGGTPMQQVIYGQEEAKYHRAARRIRNRPRHVHPHPRHLWHRRKHRHTMSAPRCAAKQSGASYSPNPPAAPTSRACAPRRKATATTGSSTARKSGPAARTSPTTASSAHAHGPQRAQAQGPDHVLSRHEKPRRRSAAASSRSPAPPTSTKSSSPTCAFPTPSAWAKWAKAGRWH